MAGLRSRVLQSVSTIFILIAAVTGDPITIKLGFLTPYPLDDAGVPQILADEWVSTIRVALDVLGGDNYHKFVVEPYIQNSDCSQDSARAAAERLVKVGVVGVVGPACSEAAMGAAAVLAKSNIPLISFAATADELNDRATYPTFFRTVSNDTQQTKAIIAVAEYFEWASMYVMFTEEAYGAGLSSSLQIRGATAGIKVNAIPLKLSMPFNNYSSYFDHVEPAEKVPVVLAVTPRVAESVYTSALNSGYMNYPWWFFGTDGATAFDLVGDGERNRKLALAMQGEIGMSPYGGSYTEDAPIRPFSDYWAQRAYSSYPGLLTYPTQPRFARPRLYVPNLIDAIWAYYWVFFDLLDSQTEVTATEVLGRLSSPNFSFEGCTGLVSWSNGGPERDATPNTAADFELMTLNGTVYNPIGLWSSRSPSDFSLTSALITRPGNLSGSPIPTSVVTTSGIIQETSAPTSLPSLIPATALTAPPTVTPLEFSGAAFAPGPTPVAEVQGVPPGALPTIDTPSVAPQGGGGGLSGGTVVAIFFGVLVFVVLGGFIYWRFVHSREENQPFVRIL